MSSKNLPLIWPNKKNSPELEAFLKQYGTEFCMSAEEINQLRDSVNEMAVIQQSTFMGTAEPSSTPTGVGNRYWTAVLPGTYANFGGVVVAANSLAIISVTANGVYNVSQATLNLTSYQKIVDGNKINPWTAKAYNSGDQVNYLGKDWVSNAPTVSGDVPGKSSLWLERLNGYVENFELTNKADLLVGKNLFNVSTIKSGFYNDSSSGVDIVNSIYSVSDFIKVSPSTQYVSSGSILRFVTYYDINKLLIPGGPQSITTFTTPNNVYYIKATVTDSVVNNVQIESGSTSTDYEVYKKTIPSYQIDSSKFLMQSNVGSYISRSNQLYDKATMNLFNTAVGVDGILVKSITGFVTMKVPISNETNINVVGFINTLYGSYRGSFYNSSGVVISNSVFSITGTGSIGQSFNKNVPIGAAWFYFMFVRNTEVISSNHYDKIMVNYGNSALPYEAYKVKNVTSSINGMNYKADLDESEVIKFLNDKNYKKVTSRVIAASKNLADPSLFTDGFFMFGSGVVIASSQYGYTGFIPVIAGSSYCGSDGVNVNAMRHICYYDSNFSIVSGGTSAADPAFTTKVIPAGVAYARVTYYVNGKSSFQFEIGTTPTNFVSYKKAFNKLISIDDAFVDYDSFSSLKINTVNIANSEVDVFFSDSYTMGDYKLIGKHYLNNISMFTDRRIENFAKSGDTLKDILARIKSDNKTYSSSIGINKYPKGGFGFIASWTNEFGAGKSMYNSVTMTEYMKDLQNVCEAVKGLGLIPVIFNEHTLGGTYGYLAQMRLKDFCFKNRYEYIDIYEQSRLIRGSVDNPKYWFGSHPGLRTDILFTQPFERFYKTLPRQKNSIKIYKKRDQFTIGTIADLIYNTKTERAKRFKELYIAQSGISTAQEKYYDDLTTLKGLGYIAQKVYDYLRLQNLESINLGTDYALIECVVNATQNNISSFNLFLTDTSIEVNVFDHINQVLVPILPTTTDGVTSYVLPEFIKYTNYDKISFILHKTGGITLTNPYFTWSGIEGKDLTKNEKLSLLRTTEVLTNPVFNSTKTGYVTTGTVTAFIPTDKNVPLGASYIVPVDNTNYVSIVATFPVDNNVTRKAQFVITGLRNVPTFDSSQEYSLSKITSDTYDFGTIALDIQYDANNIITLEHYCGLHWTDAVFEFVIPAGITSLTFSIKSSDSNELWIGKNSFKIE